MVNSITTAVRLLFLTSDFFLFSAACFGSEAVNLGIFLASGTSAELFSISFRFRHSTPFCFSLLKITPY